MQNILELVYLTLFYLYSAMDVKKIDSSNMNLQNVKLLSFFLLSIHYIRIIYESFMSKMSFLFCVKCQETFFLLCIKIASLPFFLQIKCIIHISCQTKCKENKYLIFKGLNDFSFISFLLQFYDINNK